MAVEIVEHRIPVEISHNHVRVAGTRIAMFSYLCVVCCGGGRSSLNTPVQFVPLQQNPHILLEDNLSVEEQIAVLSGKFCPRYSCGWCGAFQISSGAQEGRCVISRSVSCQST
jgi:hypothetical protein